MLCRPATDDLAAASVPCCCCWLEAHKSGQGAHRECKASLAECLKGLSQTQLQQWPLPSYLPAGNWHASTPAKTQSMPSKPHVALLLNEALGLLGAVSCMALYCMMTSEELLPAQVCLRLKFM